MKTEPLEDTTIPVKTAQAWVGTWQEMNPKRAKAFLIPMSDLINSFIEMGIATKTDDGTYRVDEIPDGAVRAYVGTNPDPSSREMQNGYGNKLFIVGTVKEGDIYRDIIKGEENAMAIEPQGSGIFDFTKPCPSDCDPQSPLLNLKSN